MFKYIGDDCEVALPPDLPEGVRPLVLVIQDESCFASHEERKTLWMQKNKTILLPKGSGRSLMVSEFFCECHGRMKTQRAAKRAISRDSGRSGNDYQDRKEC
jgi:hypothetical protein